MYERSAIVLERYLNKRFGFDQKINLRENYTNYCNIVKEVKEYQEIVLEEEGLIQKFDAVAKQIQSIQVKQTKLHESNLKLEEMRNQLFGDLVERPEILQSKLNKVEDKITENNDELKKISEEFIKALTIFAERQKDRNRCARKKRVVETNHIGYVKDEKEFFEQIDIKYIKNMKEFLESDIELIKEEISQIMLKNGKNEKVPFHKDVIQKAIIARVEIAKKELECYLTIYERSKKLLAEIDNEDLKLNRYEKAARDVSVKLAFLEAEKEYIVGFLDNERLTAINGLAQHKKMMDEACDGFESDINQIKNLYELLLKEVAGKSTKKAYKELYNKTYLKEIEQKEKNFEQEVNHIKIQMGTVINSNYWRIEGIKNIYEVFQKEITEKFERDLSEYQIEEVQEPEEFEEKHEEIDIEKFIDNYNEDFEIEFEEDEFIDEDIEEETIEDIELEDDDIDFDDKDEEDDFDFDFGDDDEDDDEEDYYDDDEEDFEDEFEIEEPQPKKVETKNKPKVYTQVRGKKMTSRKKKQKTTKKATKKKASKKINPDDVWEEQNDMPKAMKKLQKDTEKQRNKIEEIKKNTKKKKESEMKNEDDDKKLFSKLFRK